MPIKNGFCQLSKNAKKVATEIEHIIPPIKPSIFLPLQKTINLDSLI